MLLVIEIRKQTKNAERTFWPSHRHRNVLWNIHINDFQTTNKKGDWVLRPKLIMQRKGSPLSYLLNSQTPLLLPNVFQFDAMQLLIE